MMRDIIIIGGGPAGAAAGILLAEAGHDVLLIERSMLPEERVGESLLPVAGPILTRLGVDLSERYLFKQGAEFIDEPGGQQVAFRFDQGFADAPSDAWQVDRLTFDALLLERAQHVGVEVWRGATVTDVEVDTDCVRVGTDAHAGPDFEARYLIDASGQRTFLGRRGRSIVPCQSFGRAAAHGWFEDLAPDVQAELEETGNIKVLLDDDGWTWLIPLRGGKLSVGFVKRAGPISADTFHAGVAASPLIQRLTRGASASEPKLVGDFSYANVQPHGPRTVCVGDAACFLDPVFSSGVSLALAGATRMVDLLGPALAAGTEGEPELMAPLSDHLQRAYQTFASFIGRFYNTRLVQNLFFSERPDPDIHRGIVAVLSGDVWREDNPFQDMLLKPSRRNVAWPPSAP